MIPSRLTVLRALLLSLAALLTVTVLPSGGVPADLVLVLVVAVGLSSGTQAGALFGLAAGLTVDLVPPGSAPLGLTALIHAAVGAGCGVLQRSVRASILVPIVTVALATTGIQLLRLLTSLVAGQTPNLTHASALIVCTALAGAVIVPLVIRAESYLVARGLA